MSGSGMGRHFAALIFHFSVRWRLALRPPPGRRDAAASIPAAQSGTYSHSGGVRDSPDVRARLPRSHPPT